MATSHEWHDGELFVQTQLGYKEAVAGAHAAFRPQLTAQHQQFHAALNILAVCTLDGQVEVMESLDNCPKYINTRNLVAHPEHDPMMLHKSLRLAPAEHLPTKTLEYIAQADAIFLATRYTSPVQTIFKSHLGINIRGGKSGFLRITTETVTNNNGEKEERQVAYLPDYSGNRFMSSLGNIHSDKVAGITVPLMKKGLPIDIVYLTGNAQVLIGKDSSSIFLAFPQVFASR